jgi:serine/threonine protein phosphatase PrpC
VSSEILEAFAGKRLGSTATVALAWRLTPEEAAACAAAAVAESAAAAAAAAPPEWRVTVAWVGDSRGVAIIGGLGGGGAAIDLTEDHKLSLGREIARCAAVHAHEQTASPPGCRRTVVGRNRNAMGASGPWGLTNEATGITVLVTRALGDPLGASALSAVPDVASFAFGRGTRLVLASDGVWDALDGARANRCMAKLSAEQAARVLCRTAKKLRYRQHLHDDDLSALVVDLGRWPAPDTQPTTPKATVRASLAAAAGSVAAGSGGPMSPVSGAARARLFGGGSLALPLSQRSLFWFKLKGMVASSPASAPPIDDAAPTAAPAPRVERAWSAPAAALCLVPPPSVVE